MLLMALGTSIGVCALLIAFMFPQILEARQERAEARFPVIARSAPDGQGWFASAKQRFGERPLSVLYVAPRADSPRPPGVDSYAANGKAVVSPAFEQELRADPELSEVFPYGIAGTVGDSGLTAPDEWVAYVTVERKDLPATAAPLGGFGVDLNPEVDIGEGDLKTIQIALLGLVGIPLFVYFTVCARLSAASRERRLAALRLIGMSARDVQKLNALETSLAAFAGSVAGLGLFGVTHRVLASSGAGGILWFSSDSEPDLAVVLLSLIVVPILAVVVSVLGSRRVVRRALAVRRDADARSLSPLRLIPLMIGLGVLVALLIEGYRKPLGAGVGDLGVYLMLFGMVLTGVGLSLGFPVITAAVAKALARGSDRLAVLLAARRVQFERGAADRVVAGLVVAIFGLGFATGIQRDAQAVNAPEVRKGMFALQAAQLPEGAVADLERAAGIDAVVVRSSLFQVKGGRTVGSGTNVTWGSCGSLAGILGRELRGCTEGRRYSVRPLKRALPGGSPAPGSSLELSLGRPQDTWSLDVPGEVIRLPMRDLFDLGLPHVILPLSELPNGVPPATADILLAAENRPDVIQDVSREVALLAPAATLEFVNSNPDARAQAKVVQDLLYLAVALGLLVGVIAFLVTTIDRALERRPNITALAIAGVPTRLLRSSQGVQMAIPLLSGAAIAVVCSKLAEQVTVGVGGATREWAWGGVVISLTAAGVAALLAILAARFAVSESVDVSFIRRE